MSCCGMQDHGLEHGLDPALIARCAPALPFAGATPVPVYIEAEAVNTHRAIGTTLAHEVRIYLGFRVVKVKALWMPLRTRPWQTSQTGSHALFCGCIDCFSKTHWCVGGRL